jgi:methyl-accepting chemotaxis protein
MVGLVALAQWWQWDAMRQQRLAGVRAVVQTAAGIADRYRAEVAAGKMTEDEAKAQTMITINAMRFGNKDYVFTVGETGKLLQHPNPAIIGIDEFSQKDARGFKFFADVAPRAKRDGIGQVDYYNVPPNSQGAVRKLGVTLYYQPWGWYFCTGVYLDDLIDSAWQSMWQFAATTAILVICLVALAMFIARSITRPLLELRSNLRDLASGNLDTDVRLATEKHEIGDIARAVQILQQTAIEKHRTDAAHAAERERLVAEEHEAAEAAQATVAQQYVAVEGIGDALARLSEGDLTCQISQEFAPAYERLRTDFNGAVGRLQEAMQEIAKHTQAIGQGTGEIASAADDLARRTEQQAASLEQTAAALGEITSTVKQTAAGSSRAQNVVAATKEQAEQSAKVVSEAVAAMGAIEGSARQIGQIIGVIDEIAFQTNLLALNAGVEAARAGEAGRGFAVVASEVRALAQRAADAAKEIKMLVTTSMRQVEHGVALVGQTGTALGVIQSGVAEINSAIGEIAASATEQASGLAEVSAAVNQMDQVTQQNAAMVEQNTAATHSLSHETQALATAMARFRIVENASPARGHRRAA